jgi:Protein of unknown function (DUF1493)
MQKELRLKYRWIKQRRKDVLEFLDDNFGIEKNTSSKSRIEDNLGITGDDADEMIQKFEQYFNVDMRNLSFSEYFYCEGENGGIFPLLFLLKLFLFPVAVLILPFSYTTFKGIIFYSPFEGGNSPKKALTVGDLITSSFTHKFTLQSDVIIKLV